MIGLQSSAQPIPIPSSRRLIPAPTLDTSCSRFGPRLVLAQLVYHRRLPQQYCLYMYPSLCNCWYCCGHNFNPPKGSH
jgi:hypothetical protein